MLNYHLICSLVFIGEQFHKKCSWTLSVTYVLRLQIWNYWYMWQGPTSRTHKHYSEVIMSAMASRITSLTIVCSTVYSGTEQRKHQCSAPLAFVRGIHRWPVNSPHKGPVTRKIFPFDDVIMDTQIWSSFFHTNKTSQSGLYHLCVSNTLAMMTCSDNGVEQALLLIESFGDKLLWNLNQDTKQKIFIQENKIKIVFCTMLTILSWPRCIKQYQFRV